MPSARRYPPDEVGDTLIAIYRRANKRLTNLAALAIERGADGTARYYENQRNALRAQIRRVQIDSARARGQLIRTAYLTGLSAIDRVLHKERAFSDVHPAAMEVLAANLDQRLRYAEDYVGRYVEDVFRQAGLAAVTRGVAEGATPKQRTEDLARDLRARGLTAFVDKRGRRWNLDTYAAMVTRTTTREAMSRGMANRIIDHGEHLVEVSEHVGACPICIPLQGKTYTLTEEGEPEYPRLPRLPPFHPNCRHVLVPARQNFLELEAALGLGPSEEAEIGVTPFRDAADEQRGFYESGRYVGFEKAIGEEAKLAGIKVDNTERARGIWAGGGEPSAKVTVEGNPVNVRKFMDRMGARFEQDAVIRWTRDPKGHDRKYRSKAPIEISDAMIEAAVSEVNKSAKEGAEIQGATRGPDGHLEILDLGNVARDTIIAFRRLTGITFGYSRGNGDLRFDGTHYDTGRKGRGD